MVKEDEIQAEWIEKQKQLAECIKKKVASSVNTFTKKVVGNLDIL